MELPSNIEKFRGELEKTLKQANEITFKLEETKPWESKLGGCPYLEREEDYPRDGEGRPMMFLAQINLDEMPPIEDFPQTGILQFYVEDDDMYGLDSPCKVKYIENYTKDESGLLKENPYSEGYQGYEPFTGSGKITFTQRQMPVSSSTLRFEELFEDDADGEEMDALYDVCDASDSRVGGYPYFVQSSPAYYDDGICDVLLLQLDVDDDCGIMFGDSGNCTFLISRENLLKRDFSDVEYDWQCC
ncbi:MAG: DUF1963 domain-containing protein [Butyrivibrio sp.]|nr:DUF1963 domain-containing protein [Butyrivibrio sp.]